MGSKYDDLQEQVESLDTDWGRVRPLPLEDQRALRRYHQLISGVSRHAELACIILAAILAALAVIAVTTTHYEVAYFDDGTRNVCMLNETGAISYVQR